MARGCLGQGAVHYLGGCYSGGVRHTQLCYIQSQGRREVYDLSRGTHDDKINQDIYFVNEHCYNTKNSIKIFGEWNFSYRPEAWVRGWGKDVGRRACPSAKRLLRPV